MTDNAPQQPPGWYYAQGDPPGTQRYWDGTSWVGAPQPVPGAGGMAIGTETSNLAEPLPRIGARFIDGIIWAVISSIVNGIFGTFSAITNASGDLGDLDLSTGRVVLAGLVSTALIAGYEIFMVGTYGATLGKMALSIKVVKVDGSDADMETAFRRMILYIVVGVVSAIPILGILGSLANFIIFVAGLVMLFTDSLRQTPWDKVGKTIVVKK
jgi:uncharacterized RDD family membrane protein YckC